MSSSPLTSDLRSPTSSSEGEVLVRVEGVSKIFCRDLKKSLLYGLQDSARDLMSWGKRPEIRGRKSEIGSQRSDPSDSSLTSDIRSPTSESRALRSGEFLAVDNVSFELRRGECLGLIGRNGAGKTTLLKMLNGLIKPDSGRIEMRGRVGALIALGAGFNPILSGRENIYVNGSILGLSKAEIDEKIDDIIDFAEIGEFIDAPVQSYSSGMQVRLGFAVATAMEPDVLILDEVLAVGDRRFRSKCIKRVSQIIGKCAVLFVSHTAADIQQICDSVLWLEKGLTNYYGVTELGLQEYAAASKFVVTGSTNLLAPIVSAKLAPLLKVAIIGDDLEIKIDVVSSAPSEIDYFVGAIVAENGETVAQFYPPWKKYLLEIGDNRICFKIRNLRLTPGFYMLNALCCGSGGKTMYFHLSQHGRFETKGGGFLWAAYQPETTP
jgi:lipopolysaccharide transport system ATP-binding protein